ncbi:MAG: ribonucleotide-diphosphate reductase subunit beta, partial [Actinomycetota bacterium]|nr:ribonucleotide-diphosphate reductase subunit beta [Actinomycetota bacterium]
MVVDGLGRGQVVSYDRLYRLWEQNPWSATQIDLTTDKNHWRERLTSRQREAVLWQYAMFLMSEERAAGALTTVLDASPGFGETIFLSTQIVDEARHHVFFDRFMREVASQGHDTASTLKAVKRHLSWGFTQVLAELDKTVESLRKKPKDRVLLTQTVVLYHVIIEGALAVPERQFIPRYIEKAGILPGLNEGMKNVFRDETRHVAFGVKFLSDLIRSSKECRQAMIETLDRALRWSVGFFLPRNLDYSFIECFDFTPQEIFTSSMRFLDDNLKKIGIA